MCCFHLFKSFSFGSFFFSFKHFQFCISFGFFFKFQFYSPNVLQIVAIPTLSFSSICFILFISGYTQMFCRCISTYLRAANINCHFLLGIIGYRVRFLWFDFDLVYVWWYTMSIPVVTNVSPIVQQQLLSPYGFIIHFLLHYLQLHYQRICIRRLIVFLLTGLNSLADRYLVRNQIPI